jgi:hypothetical protein
VDIYALIAGTIADVEPDQALAEKMEALVSRWTLDKTLRSVPGVGPSKRHDVLSVFRASPRIRLGNLTFARRQELSNLARAATDPRVMRLGDTP